MTQWVECRTLGFAQMVISEPWDEAPHSAGSLLEDFSPSPSPRCPLSFSLPGSPLSKVNKLIFKNKIKQNVHSGLFSNV